jgi:hypothetical protein
MYGLPLVLCPHAGEAGQDPAQILFPLVPLQMGREEERVGRFIVNVS